MLGGGVCILHSIGKRSSKSWEWDFSFFFFLLVFVVVVFFLNRVSLCSPSCPGTHFVDQAGLELRNPPGMSSFIIDHYMMF